MTDKIVAQSYWVYAFQQAKGLTGKALREFSSIFITKIPTFVGAFSGVIGTTHVVAAYDQLLRQPNSVGTISIGLCYACIAGVWVGMVPVAFRVMKNMVAKYSPN